MQIEYLCTWLTERTPCCGGKVAYIVPLNVAQKLKNLGQLTEVKVVGSSPPARGYHIRVQKDNSIGLQRLQVGAAVLPDCLTPQ